MMGFVTIREAARRDGRAATTLRQLCLTGRVPGARKLGRDWIVPVDAEGRPVVPRLKMGRPHKDA